MTRGTADFRSSEFEIEHRVDDPILMMQKGDLAGFLPTLANYLD